MKACSECKEMKSLDNYTKDPRHVSGYRRVCKACNSLKTQGYKAKNPDKYRYWRLKHRYGLTQQQVKALEVAAGGRCAICKESAKLVVDHDHQSGEVRGLLCNSCNKGIGYLRESQEILDAAKAYLAKPVLLQESGIGGV